MTLTIGAATDYLYGLAQAAVAGITVNSQPAVAIDGWPEELTFGMFIIGLSRPPPDGVGDTTGSRGFSTIGNLMADEDYVIPCFIDVRIAGNVQKTARDLAESIFNPFWTEFKADTSLDGILRGGGYAEIGSLTSTPTNVGTVAEPGRRQALSFDVHCHNLTA